MKPRPHHRLGYLSQEIETARSTLRAQFPHRFFIAESFSNMCWMSLDQLRPLEQTEHNDLIASLFHRVTHFLAESLVDCERGAVSAARTLIRAAYETLFYIGAILNGKLTFKELERDKAPAVT